MHWTLSENERVVDWHRRYGHGPGAWRMQRLKFNAFDHLTLSPSTFASAQIFDVLCSARAGGTFVDASTASE